MFLDKRPENRKMQTHHQAMIFYTCRCHWANLESYYNSRRHEHPRFIFQYNSFFVLKFFRRILNQAQAHSMDPYKRNGRINGTTVKEFSEWKNCICIYGLSLLTNEMRLREIFGRFGPIKECTFKMEPSFGHPRGLAVIHFQHNEDARKAKTCCDGIEIDDHQIRVEYSRSIVPVIRRRSSTSLESSQIYFCRKLTASWIWLISLFLNIIYCSVRVLFVICNNLYCIPTYLVWIIVFQPVRLISEDVYRSVEGRLFHWLLSMVGLWSYSAGYDMVESGDRIDEVAEDECLVLVNHQSTSDVPLLMSGFHGRPGLLPNITWIMDGIFKYTNFGLVAVIHGDFFIKPGRDRREKTIRELQDFLRDVYGPLRRKWIVLFPEGGFLRKRLEASKRFAAKNGLPDMDYVTVPRTGAAQAIIDAIGPGASVTEFKPDGITNNNHESPPGRLKYIIDLTIAYPKGEPLDLLTVILGHKRPCDIHLHYRVYPIEQVPCSPPEFQTWLFDQYIEKNRILGNYYATGEWKLGLNDLDDLKYGKLGKKNSRPVRVEYDLLRIILVHLFFLLSSYFHISLYRHIRDAFFVGY